MAADLTNSDFTLATRFVQHTGKSIFLTGKAGTGKTTFLQHIRNNTFKKLAVVAPTGVAAINAGGVTMHSLFQLPFGPFIPSDPDSLLANLRLTIVKRELLQELELLIIDEVSMVRADMLDAVDTILRHFRNQPYAPFGGVQVVYIGDLFQLPPVVSNEEWQLLKSYYDSPFFFDARVVREQPPIYLELRKIYRQQDAGFIDMLNNIRNAKATPADLERLHDHYEPEFVPPSNSSYITLTSHNARAEHINQHELTRVKGQVHVFEATVTGEFSDKAYPAEKTLQLKEGAQIMLIKNDKGETRRYFNGKIGTIKKLGEKITIAFPNEPDDLVLEKEVWRNIRYRFNHEKDKIEEEELGTFAQYPIRLAWAITIHKSQGLTFDRAVIDAGRSFAPGQVYVALSRLRSLDGLVLQSRILPSSITTDARVMEYTDSRLSDRELAYHLQHEQHAWINTTLQKTFDWTRLTEALALHHTGYENRQIPDRPRAIIRSANWLAAAVQQEETAKKFARQLDVLIAHAKDDNYVLLQQRMLAAAGWFLRSLEEDQLKPLQAHIEEIRSQKKIKKYLAELQQLSTSIARKKQQLEDALKMVDGLQQGRDTTDLLTDLDEAKRARETPPQQNPMPAAAAKSAKVPKGETNRISLQLFKEGIGIADIAARRNLTVSTIENHLTSFIPTGDIGIKELVAEEKIDRIRATFEEMGNTTLNALKARLGEEFSFGEIRAVLQHIRLHSPTPPAGS